MVKVRTPELPAPEEAKRPGWKEVARVWRLTEGDETTCAATIRTISRDPADWTFVLATLARSAARPFALATKVPKQMLDTAVETMAYGMVRGAAHDDFAEIDEIVQAAEDVLTEDEDEPHPGELGVPDFAWERPDAIQAASVWIVPDIDCPGCGETHKGGAFAGVTTAENLSPEDFGRALGAAARTCASMIVDTRGGDFDSVFMTIQTAMMEEPQEESYGLQADPAHKH